MALCEIVGCKEQGESVTLTLQTSPPIDGGILSKHVRLCEKHLVGPQAGVACAEGTTVRLTWTKE